MRLNRLLYVVVAGLVASSALPAQDASPREQAADQQVLHALNRLAFGPRPGDVVRVRSIGLDSWIEQQLRPERINDTTLDRFLAQYQTLQRDQNELLRTYADAQRDRRQIRADSGRALTRQDSMELRQRGEQLRAVVTDLQSAKVARAVASERQLQEVMTDFWFNHFNVFIRKGGPQPFYMASYERGIRERVFGKFRDLLEFTAKSPAMLFYLDNARSMADSGRETLASLEMRSRLEGMARRRGAVRRPQPPQQQQQRRRQGLNENYGRELLELHTLGVDGGYTQQDVIEVARALTGWTINQPQQSGGGFVFRPIMHDAGEKTVLGRRLAAGRGIEDGEQVLDIVARHPSTARHIATKLARRFVSDSPSTALIERTAAVFTRTDGDIREVLRSIITSSDFLSSEAYRSKVKSPFEVVVSAARALGAAPDPTPRTALVVAYLGQPLYGHQAPNGYPETGSAWINTGSILNRINFGLAAAAGRLPGVSAATSPFGTELQAADREHQVDAVISALLGGKVSPDTRAILVSGDHPMIQSGAVAAATSEAEQRVMREDEMGTSAAPVTPAARAASMRRNAVLGRAGETAQLQGLAQVIGLALGSPEFQRR